MSISAPISCEQSSWAAGDESGQLILEPSGGGRGRDRLWFPRSYKTPSSLRCRCSASLPSTWWTIDPSDARRVLLWAARLQSPVKAGLNLHRDRITVHCRQIAFHGCAFCVWIHSFDPHAFCSHSENVPLPSFLPSPRIH